MVIRKHRLEIAAAIVLGLVAALAIWSGISPILPHKPYYPFIPSVTYIHMPSQADVASASAIRRGSGDISSIPVLSYHQMDNGCAATSARCGAGPDSVSQQQFYDQMNWLHSHGYHTITAPEYTLWATSRRVSLPSKPILLTVDDGIANFYGPATPVLEHFGYNMVSMIVSGFAQGAQNNVRRYAGWDATWTQLGNLPRSVWSFAFHAGPKGHLIYSGKGACPYFYSCQAAGEPDAGYKARVTEEIDAGLRAEKRNLGARIDTQMWAVPFNDLAQTRTQPQSGREPRPWLNNLAASKFKVVFVDGLTTRDNQHYRYEVHSADSLTYFAQQVSRSKVFTRRAGNATAAARAGGTS